MKKAKQFLSLMLVVVMVLGMMVFVPGTASAKNVNDYPDADSIEYTEAVDVLSALGVLTGDDSGAFNPKSNITREQAAKIITYILIGTTSADRLAPRASSFTDVETSRWSNPYIEYCVEKGIIRGYGDGRFGPADPVTAAQMAKMLLMCIGYGGKGEYDNADSWQLNTIVDGQKRGILTLDKDYTQPASREEVAKYTFNAMVHKDAFLVTYSDLAKEYLPRGSSIFTSVSQTFLGAETFGLMKYRTQDKLGHGTHYWYKDKITNKLTDEYISDIIVGSFVSGALSTKGSLFSSYKWPESSHAPIEVYVNGAEESLTPVYASDGVTITGYSSRFVKSDFAVRGDSITIPFPNGSYVELLDTNEDSAVDKIVVTYEILAQVTKVNAYTGTINVQLYDFGVDQPSNKYGTTSIFAEGFAVDDYVLIVPAQNSVTTNAGVFQLTPSYTTVPHRVVAAESLQAELTAYTSTPNNPAAYPTLTFGGKTYNVAAGLGYASALPTFGDATFFLDSYGSVIGFDANSETAATRNYLYVSACQFEGLSSFYASAAKVRVSYTDGTEAILSLPMSSNGKIAYGPNNTPIDLTASSLPSSSYLNGWYSYTFNANGEVRLTRLLDGSTNLAVLGKAEGLTSGTTLEIEGGVAFVKVNGSSVRVTSSTNLSVINNGIRKTYTGFSNFPTYTDSKQLVVSGGSQILLVYAPGGASIAAIYVVNGNVGVIGNYGILLGKDSVQGDGVHYTVFVDGETRTIVSDITTLSGGTIVSVGDEDELAAAATDGVVRLVSGTVASADPSYIQVFNSGTNAFEFYYYETDTLTAFNEYGSMFADMAMFWTTGTKINATTLRDYNITAKMVVDEDDTILAVAFIGAAKSGDSGKTVVSYALSATNATGLVGGTYAQALASITVNVTYSDATTDALPISDFIIGDPTQFGIADPTIAPTATFASAGPVTVIILVPVSFAVVGGYTGTPPSFLFNTPITITVS